MNLVGGFHALGTLLAVGIMMLPAVIARFWARDITAMIADRDRERRALGLCGLLVSFHAGRRPGPPIILVAGALYAVSVLFGPRRRADAASFCPDAISKPEARHAERDVVALAAARRYCSRGAGRARRSKTEGRRDLLDPRRLRAERRRRPRRRRRAGRPERRRACLSALARRREDARRRQASCSSTGSASKAG